MSEKFKKPRWRSFSSLYAKHDTKKLNDIRLNVVTETSDRHYGEVLTPGILTKNTRQLLMNQIRKLKGCDNLFVQMEARSMTRAAFELLSEDELSHAFLWAAFLGNLEFLKMLRELGADLYFVVDCNNYNALHLSAMSGSLECVQWLVEEGCNVNAVVNGLTPLHHAVLVNSVKITRYLIDAGCNVFNTTLHSAVAANSLECLRLLLSTGVDVNAKDDHGVTALHLGAERGRVKCLNELLNSVETKVNLKTDHEGYTALHYAAEEGYTECIELLMQKGADINEVSNQNKTALHLASKTQYLDCVEMLLKYGASVNMLDIDRKTAVHMAVSKSKFSLQVVKLLVEWNADVNIADKCGFTPLHIAALNELTECVEYLILKGANVAAKTLGGISALNIINRKTPRVLSAISTRLDAALAYTTQQTLKFNFRDIINNSDVGEIGFLHQMTVEGKAEILKHPLCRAFLHLKWEKIRPYYLLRVFLMLIITVLYSFYVIAETTCVCMVVHKHICANNSKCAAGGELDQELKSQLTAFRANNTCFINGIPITDHVIVVIYYVLLFLTALNLIRVFFSLSAYKSVKHYLSNFSNILLWFTIIFSFIITTFTACNILYNSISAITVLTSWTYLMFRVGQLPFFGTYIAMYTSVQKQFAKLILAYLCLLAGFASSFCVIFPTNQHFDNPLTAFVKVIAMMTGELDTDDLTAITENENNSIFTITVYLIFLTFVMFVTVILMNLLVGIAVNNVEELQKTADLMILKQQTTLIYFMELACFRGHLPKRISNFIQELVYVSPNAYKVVIYVRPFSPEEKRLPRDIMEDGLEAALKRKTVKTDDVQSKIKKRIDKLEDQIILLQKMIVNLTNQNSCGSALEENSRKNKDFEKKEGQRDDLSYISLEEEQADTAQSKESV